MKNTRRILTLLVVFGIAFCFSISFFANQTKGMTWTYDQFFSMWFPGGRTNSSAGGIEYITGSGQVGNGGSVSYSSLPYGSVFDGQYSNLYGLNPHAVNNDFNYSWVNTRAGNNFSAFDPYHNVRVWHPIPWNWNTSGYHLQNVFLVALFKQHGSSFPTFNLSFQARDWTGKNYNSSWVDGSNPYRMNYYSSNMNGSNPIHDLTISPDWVNTWFFAQEKYAAVNVTSQYDWTNDTGIIIGSGMLRVSLNLDEGTYSSGGGLSVDYVGLIYTYFTGEVTVGLPDLSSDYMIDNFTNFWTYSLVIFIPAGMMLVMPESVRKYAFIFMVCVMMIVLTIIRPDFAVFLFMGLAGIGILFYKGGGIVSSLLIMTAIVILIGIFTQFFPIYLIVITTLLYVGTIFMESGGGMDE